MAGEGPGKYYGEMNTSVDIEVPAAVTVHCLVFAWSPYKPPGPTGSRGVFRNGDAARQSAASTGRIRGAHVGSAHVIEDSTAGKCPESRGRSRT